MLYWLNIFSHPCALQRPDPEPSLLASILHSSHGRSHKSVASPRDLPLAGPTALSRGPATHHRCPHLYQGCALTWGHTLHYAFLGFGTCERKHTVHQRCPAKNPLVSGHGWLSVLTRCSGELAPPAKTQAICRAGRRDQLPSPIKSTSTFVSGVG